MSAEFFLLHAKLQTKDIFSITKKSMQPENHMDSKFEVGGDKEDRTPDLLHAMQALSQLSYAPRDLIIIFYKAEDCQGLFSGSPGFSPGLRIRVVQPSSCLI